MALEELLQELNRGGGWDWCIRSFDGCSLSLSAGSSSSYAQHVVAFHGVCYLACPTEFSHPTFRVASTAERLSLSAQVAVDEDDTVVAIDADSSVGMEPLTFFIVATSATLAAAGGVATTRAALVGAKAWPYRANSVGK
ncbi:hypothetical protein F2P44_16435 [Massilia sp. CCM 8695]|uniref:DUF2591 domain-containing protein n=1 Tax=Massilia frigida TaxID=2609281 RepID=A0ABX0N665_9BURK|nr:hypothetical protein [Massilia frigida]NHZ80850.1 hypothetical protein [Massilia frigida]